MSNPDISAVNKIVDQFPYGYRYLAIIDKRQKIAEMVSSYLTSDTFGDACEVYRKFFVAHFYGRVLDLDPKSDDYLSYNLWLGTDLQEWENKLRQAWLDAHGPRHTQEEVMQLAADFWCDRIFRDHPQYDIPPVVQNRARALFAEYYGMIFNLPLTDYIYSGLSSGSDSCESLYNILLQAGVEEKDILLIAPYGTRLLLCHFDKSLLCDTLDGTYLYL